MNENDVKSVAENSTDLETVTEYKDNENKKKLKKKQKKTRKIIFNIFTILLFIFIVVEAAIGIVNMQRINNEEEPIWYLTTKTTETELKTETEYNLGLYKIVKTDTAKETKITLKPFFLSN